MNRLITVLFSLSLCLNSAPAFAHGGVAFEDDVCLININFLQAHFTVFQPEQSEADEFCESIPDVARSVFVMEYLHDLLPEMLIDLRIIRDLDKLGRFAAWSDIEAIEDLSAVTVFYEEPRIEGGGYYSTEYTFEEEGAYIGIVTARHPTDGREYNAVFYFQVGGADWGTLPLFALLLLGVHGLYWLSSGGPERRRQKRAQRAA
ncbi:MAG: hypothetical protein P1V29_08825 [Gammaproteobacteria bacterium]|nr:hypothetical protein [Gammaproteobacteria bacterium]